MRPPADDVVLLDPAGRPTGKAPRATVHGRTTPLHLAFSCYLLDAAGRVLLTRRALGKRTWPGVWTNAFCGHPRPGEPMQDAVRRHAGHELDIAVHDLEVLLPDFRYTARDAAGVVENEVCPVWFASSDDTLDPNPDEVMDLTWVSTTDLGRAVSAAPWAFSPWLVAQVVELADLVPVVDAAPAA